MKQLFILLLFVLPFASNAQGVDSNAIRVPVALQIRDWYKVESIVHNREQYETLYDTLKAGLRASGAGATSTVVATRNVSIRNILGIAQAIRQAPYSDAFFYFTRINTAFRNISNAYLQRKLDELDEAYEAQYNQTLLNEYNRVRNPQ